MNRGSYQYTLLFCSSTFFSFMQPAGWIFAQNASEKSIMKCIGILFVSAWERVEWRALWMWHIELIQIIWVSYEIDAKLFSVQWMNEWMNCRWQKSFYYLSTYIQPRTFVRIESDKRFFDYRIIERHTNQLKVKRRTQYMLMLMLSHTNLYV